MPDANQVRRLEIEVIRAAVLVALAALAILVAFPALIDLAARARP